MLPPISRDKDIFKTSDHQPENNIKNKLNF